jgi:hypothetical protein
MPSGRSLGWPGTRPRRPGRGYIRESGSILHVVGMGVKRIGMDGCKCECKINIEYVALVFIISFGTPFISIVFLYLAVTAIGAILKKINFFSKDT